MWGPSSGVFSDVVCNNVRMQLEAADYAAILDVLESVAGSHDTRDYAARVSAGLFRLFPCQGASCTEIDVTGRRVVSEPAPPFPSGWIAQYGPAFEEFAWQHPLFGKLISGERVGPTSWSVDGAESAFARTELYRSFYEPNGVRRQTVLIFPTPHGTSIVISIDCAAAHPCGGREAAMLSTIAPLLETSYRLVSRAEGNLVWPFADAGGAVNGGATPPAGSVPREPLGESSDKLTIDDAQLRAHQALRSAGLTARQAEIALMVASGAATSQIATTLQISPGTVRKHLEAVHATLGVSSRAAVAATVMRLVHPEAADILGKPLLSR